MNKKNKPQSVNLEILRDNFNLIENLWRQLSGPTWLPAIGNRMSSLTQQLGQMAVKKEQTIIAELASKLEQIIFIVRQSQKTLMYQGEVVSILNSIRQELVRTDKTSELTSPSDEVLQLKAELANQVLIISPEDASQEISKKLQELGFHMRHLTNLEEAAFILAISTPLALLVDLSFPEKSLAGAQLIQKIRMVRAITCPIFFLGGANSFNERLKAIEAGGTAYFPKPVEFPLLAEKLRQRLFKKPLNFISRILIINDQIQDQQHFDKVLNAKGFDYKLLMQPQQALNTIDEFNPRLIVLNLALKSIDGLSFFKLLRQYKSTTNTPMILLANRQDLNHQLIQLEGENIDLLCNPTEPEYLSWFIQQRLYQINSLKNQINFLNTHDKLTGLLNRHLFLSKVKKHFSTPDKNRAVLFVMLENMRLIREQFDAATIDEILVSLVAMLKKALVSIADKVQLKSRFNDAMFALLIIDQKQEQLLETASRIKKIMESPVLKVDKKILKLKVSIGACITQANQSNNYLQILQQADQACSYAMNKTKKHIHIVTTELALNVPSIVPASLSEAINYAIENDGIKLFFQPIVSVLNDHQERYELFLRLYEKDGNEMLSESIFKIIDNHPINAALDRWVLIQAIRLLRERQDRVNLSFLFVNISLWTLKDKKLHNWLQERLENLKIKPGQLVFEFSERTLLESTESVRHFMELFSTLGCSFSLQQYTDNEKNKNLVKQFNFQYLKPNIDLFNNIQTEESRQKLKKMIQFLNDNNMTAIACNVEDINSLPIIWSIGVQYVQGYFLQQPQLSMSYDFSNSIF